MRKILFPFSILYWCITLLRNYFYNKGWLRSFAFDFPIICVGNLNTGGTGKTPHVEYLIRHLQRKYKVAMLSRGYRRKLKGYVLATELSLVEDIGDEPKQFKQKFPETEVCVSEDRVAGVYQLLQDEPAVQVILMDDGLQHRRINPGLKILLTAYNDLFCDDRILPAGNLREPRSGYKRMQLIIITKCPGDLKDYEKHEIIKRLKLLSSQRVFFTTEIYEELKPLFAKQKMQIADKTSTGLFVSGIATNTSAVNHLKQKFVSVEIKQFPDHYYFSEQDIIRIKEMGKNKNIITTEKDAMRMMEHKEYILEKEISIFILPLSIQFLFNEGDSFHRLVEEYVQSAMPV